MNSEIQKEKTVYIYSDNFQPPHIGKLAIWDDLCEKHGIDNCYIEVFDDNGHLSCLDKISIMAAMGIDTGKVIETNSHFDLNSIQKKLNSDNLHLVFILSDGKLESIANREHINCIEYGNDKLNFKIKGKKLSVGDSDILKLLGDTDVQFEDSMDLFKRVFGFFDEHLYNVVTGKLERNSSLSESKINESPDSNLKAGTNWNDSDAVSFFIFPDFNIHVNIDAVSNEYQTTHNAIIHFIVDMGEYGTVDEIKSVLDVGEYENADGDIIDLTIFKINNVENFAKYALHGKISGNIRKNGLFCGRMWKHKKIISLWKESIFDIGFDGWVMLKNFTQKEIGAKPSTFMYENGIELDNEVDINSESNLKLLTYIEVETRFSGNNIEKKEDSEEFLKTLQSNIHVMNPADKKQALMKLMGITKDVDTNSNQLKNKKSEIADKLNMTVAELNHIWNMNEIVLCEDPDSIELETGTELMWNVKGAVTFYIFDNFTIFCNSKLKSKFKFSPVNIPDTACTHGYLTDFMFSMRRNYSELEIHEIFKSKKFLGKDLPVQVGGNFDSFVAYMKSTNPLSDKEYRQNGILCGRIWINQKYISFWKNNITNIGNTGWEKLKAFISRDMSENPEHFKFENPFGEKYNKILTYDDVEKLFKLGNIKPSEESPEYIKKINQIKHVLTPDVKRLLKTLDVDTPPNKKAEIADKIGMTVSELNHILQINENIIVENPDNLTIQAPDKNSITKKISWSDGDAKCFMLFKDVFFSAKDGIDDLYHASMYNDITDGDFNFIDVWGDYADIANIVEKIKSSMIRSKQFSTVRNFAVVTGRMWTTRKVFSTWDASFDILLKKIKTVELFFEKALELDITEYSFNVDDGTDTTITYQQLKNKDFGNLSKKQEPIDTQNLPHLKGGRVKTTADLDIPMKSNGVKSWQIPALEEEFLEFIKNYKKN